MDTFTPISVASKAPASKNPSDNETEPIDQGSGGYCVVFSKNIPSTAETEMTVPVIGSLIAFQPFIRPPSNPFQIYTFNNLKLFPGLHQVVDALR
ncbi:hypothetical protein DFP72DRAFT_1074111 [Ephemerocybe angulata]|uniref:Uncharacterized protein n=1 Tax=Ephemerocybe angulata TaxID=980116 RepID=A0A8H6HMH2_9AGAR|nr:hypothetical protein DFP72DRAFT_1074111 [Tulosesus angulatus]